jgi:hypothetical protein
VANVIKLFMLLIYDFAYKAREFVRRG